ncbi:hypothetical protein NYP18_13765 [Corynebacterium sp. YIM 101645]|uniref:Or membrane protein n=1 Tax=Corynebacterium lemuris TaxID=1859292 RepID=A0ABT2G355_9CORY|nr:hypothetical protein [Corynebacterium lemuris]MCS5480712.1 hypothetical protein [Corynebacterium lemuris]
MRNFRTASVAATTALALTFAGTSVAYADSEDRKDGRGSTIPTSSQIGKEWGAWTDSEDGPVVEDENKVTGTDLLGSSVSDDNPEWADNWRDMTYLGIAGSTIGSIFAGLNWLNFVTTR